MANVGEHCMVKDCRLRAEREVFIGWDVKTRADLEEVDIPEIKTCVGHAEEITHHPERFRINWDAKSASSLLVRREAS